MTNSRFKKITYLLLLLPLLLFVARGVVFAQATFDISGLLNSGAFFDPGESVDAQLQLLQDILKRQQESLHIDISPASPGPNEQVTITIQSFNTNLDMAGISWIVNGQIKKQGVGERTFTTNTGPVGTETDITVRIDAEDIPEFERSIVIRPTEVEMLWEAHSYTPPLYKGRTLASPGSKITVTALPTISSSESLLARMDSLIYTWKVNGKVVSEYSGFGEHTLKTWTSRYSKSTVVEVKVELQGAGVVGNGKIIIPPSDPEVVVYHDSPLLGVVFEHALDGTVHLNDAEYEVSAFPYYFITDSRHNDTMLYKWSVGNRTVGEQGIPEPSLTFRKGEGVGEASVNVRVENHGTVAQIENNSLLLTFGAQNVR